MTILDAYIAMTTDETLRSEVERYVRIDLLCAEWALSVVIDEMAEQLGQAGDSYLAERGHDIKFVGQGIMQSLSGHADSTLLPRGRQPGVRTAQRMSIISIYGRTDLVPPRSPACWWPTTFHPRKR